MNCCNLFVVVAVVGVLAVCLLFLLVCVDTDCVHILSESLRVLKNSFQFHRKLTMFTNIHTFTHCTLYIECFIENSGFLFNFSISYTIYVHTYIPSPRQWVRWGASSFAWLILLSKLWQFVVVCIVQWRGGGGAVAGGGEGVGSRSGGRERV